MIMNIADSVSVTKATQEQFDYYVTHPSRSKAIVEGNGGIVPEHTEESYIATLYKYSLMFTLDELTPGVYETHICCLPDSIKASRALVLGGMQWLMTEHNPNTKGIFTSCPKGKISNFLKKLGFEHIDTIGAKLYFSYVFKNIN